MVPRERRGAEPSRGREDRASGAPRARGSPAPAARHAHHDVAAAHVEALEMAQRRIENLEAIVTNQMWDAVHDETLPEVERQRALTQARIHLDPPEPSDAERVARMAQRLKH